MKKLKQVRLPPLNRYEQLVPATPTKRGIEFRGPGLSSPARSTFEFVKRTSSFAPATDQRVSTMGTCWVMLTDVVGTSVLTFAGVARLLGWIPTVVVIVGLAPLAVYSASLMSRARDKLAYIGDREFMLLTLDAPSTPVTMGEAARIAYNDNMARLVYLMVYGFAYLGNASYLIVLGQAFQGTFPEYKLCLSNAILVSCCLLTPMLVTIRQLVQSVWLCFINFFVILAVLGIVIGQMIHDGPNPEAHRFLVAENITLAAACGAATNVVYSFTGHWLYFELMNEMEEPDDFPSVFYINAPIQVALYLFVALVGYWYAGDLAEGYFLDNLPSGRAAQVASGLLFLHVSVVFLVKNVVLARYLHGVIAPTRVDERCSWEGGWLAQAQYAFVSIALMASGALIAFTIPFVMEFMGLIGGLFSGPVSFFLPMALLWTSMNKMAALERSERALLSTASSSDNEEQSGQNAEAMPKMLQEPGLSRDEDGVLWNFPKGDKFTRWDYLAYFVISIFIALTMVAGTFQNIDVISARIGIATDACQALQVE